MTKNIKPPGVGRAEGLKENNQQADSASDEQPRQHHYFLHVTDGGTELRFDHAPELPCLYVEQLADGTEQTRTRYVVIAVKDAAVTMAAARPRGRGWVMHDNSSDKHAIWRRMRS